MALVQNGCKKTLLRRLAIVTLLVSCISIVLLQTNYYQQIEPFHIQDMCFKNKSVPWQSTGPICHCGRSQKLHAAPPAIFSTCDYYSTYRGPLQNVVSYTFFGNTSSLYFQGVELSINATAKSFPGWIMRLYHNFNMSDKNESDQLCRLWCKYHHFDLCDIHHLPYPLCDISAVYGELWRFFVLGDPLVDRFMVRDIDAPIIDREIAAVKEWLNSNKSWHIMRDHPLHGTEILAGMWGGRNSDLNLTTKLRNDFILRGTPKTFGLDQALLRTVVWPFVFKDAMIHDSYTCQIYPYSRPFPTQKESNTSWVGHSYEWRVQHQIGLKCPIKCRPKEHLDWEYC